MNDAELTLQIEDEILEKYNWGNIENMFAERYASGPCKIKSGTLYPEKEASHAKRTGDDGYGEWSQGSTDKVWLILRLEAPNQTPLYFRKGGTADSYGETTWDGTFRRVFSKAKTVTVYEYGE